MSEGELLEYGIALVKNWQKHDITFKDIASTCVLCVALLIMILIMIDVTFPFFHRVPVLKRCLKDEKNECEEKSIRVESKPKQNEQEEINQEDQNN